MKQSLILLVLCLGCFFPAGCAKEPEGPAQRIGRGLDDIMGGFNDMNDDPSYRGSRDTSGADSYREAPRERSNDNRYRDGSYGTPRCDPLYDSKCDDPYWPNRDKDSDDRGDDRAY